MAWGMRELLEQIGLDANESNDDGEVPGIAPSVVFIDSWYSDTTTESE